MKNSTTPPDYEKLEAEQKIINRNSVRSALSNNNKHLIKKIHTFAQNYDYDISVIKEKIRNDEMFAARFAILPITQGFHQKIASGYIKTLPMVENFKLLPVSGKDACYIDGHGAIVKKEKLPKNFSLTKSLDFSWETVGYKFFASHKYTRGCGGAQDNQYKDIKIALEYYQKGGADEGNIFFAICDGPYYKDKNNRKKKN